MHSRCLYCNPFYRVALKSWYIEFYFYFESSCIFCHEFFSSKCPQCLVVESRPAVNLLTLRLNCGKMLGPWSVCLSTQVITAHSTWYVLNGVRELSEFFFAEALSHCQCPQKFLATTTYVYFEFLRAFCVKFKWSEICLKAVSDDFIL